MRDQPTSELASQRQRALAPATCYAAATELLDNLIEKSIETARIRKRHVRQRIAGMEPWPVRGPSKQAAHLWLFYIRAVEHHKNATKKVRLLRRLREAA